MNKIKINLSSLQNTTEGLLCNNKGREKREHSKMAVQQTL